MRGKTQGKDLGGFKKYLTIRLGNPSEPIKLKVQFSVMISSMVPYSVVGCNERPGSLRAT